MKQIRIVLLFIKNLIIGHLSFWWFKIKNGRKSYYCTDSDTENSKGENACYEQCHFCKTSTNTWRGLKFWDKKTKRFYKIGKWVE